MNLEGARGREVLGKEGADGGVEIGETVADGGAEDATRELHLAHDVVKEGDFVGRGLGGGA